MFTWRLQYCKGTNAQKQIKMGFYTFVKPRFDFFSYLNLIFSFLCHSFRRLRRITAHFTDPCSLFGPMDRTRLDCWLCYDRNLVLRDNHIPCYEWSFRRVFSDCKRKRSIWPWLKREEAKTMGWRRATERKRRPVAPVSSPIPILVEATRLILPAEIREKNRLPTV